MPIEWVLMADMVLMTVRGTDGPPSLSEAAAQLHIPVQDIDAAYGVVPLGQDLYAVQIDPQHLPAQRESTEPYRGPFSNPRIEPFGPVQTTPEVDKPQRKPSRDR
jgi:hypothetical protein